MAVIARMSENDLETFIPTIGDRVSVKLYVEEELKKKASNAQSDKKQKLLRQLRKKLGIMRKADDSETSDSCDDNPKHEVPKGKARKMARMGNKCASKKNRKIEIGWVHTNKQVRKVNGGGTRNLSVPKDSGRDFVLTEAKKLFFPEGSSPMGLETEFKITLSDFALQEITNETIEQLYESRKVTRLRLYMMTEPLTDTECAASSVSKGSGEGDHGAVPFVPLAHSTGTEEIVILDDIDEVTYQEEELAWSDEVVVGHSHPQIPDDVLNDTIPTTGNYKFCTLIRGQVHKGLLTFFKEEEFDLRFDTLKISIKNEKGQDSGGVFRDALSEFWESFYMKNTVGSNVKVPITSPFTQKEDWLSVAKIVIVGYRQEGYFPILLSPVVLDKCINMLDHPVQDILVEFLSTLSEIDREVCETALNDFESVDEDDLLEVLSNYDARAFPKKDNIRDILGDIAMHEVIHRTAFICECCGPLLQQYLRPLLPDGGLTALFGELSVSHKKVLKLLKVPEQLTKEEKRTIDALKQYIKNCSSDKLGAFLRFCTGSDLVTGKQISLILTQPMSDFSCRPIAHTCGPTLELSTSYSSYLKLREDFDKVLDSKVLLMDII